MKTKQAFKLSDFYDQFYTSFCILLFCCLFFANFGSAQPGPQHQSSNFVCDIVDENGKEISFQKDSTYQIHINGKRQVLTKPLVKTEIIDTLTNLKFIPSYNQFMQDLERCLYVTINDFQTRFVPDVPEDNYYKIQIIHGSDTMFIYDGYTPYPVRKFQFIPGHYSFPRWSTAVLDHAPQISGNVALMNLDQRNFIVPKARFPDTRVNRDAIDKREAFVAQKFIDSVYSVEMREEKTTSNLSFAPYSAEGFNALYPTNEENMYIGTVRFNLSQYNYSRSNQVVCLFNKKENTIEYKAPKNNLDLFYCTGLFVDTFNHVYYQTVGVRDSFADPSCVNSSEGPCAFTKQALRSDDNGKTWTEDKSLTSFFQRFDYFQLNFLDKNYAVASVRKQDFTKLKGRTHQAVYYLFRNGKLIDSLKSPVYARPDDDFQNHIIKLANDSIILGIWHTSKYDPDQFKAHSPMLVQIGDKWKFRVADYKQHHATWNNRKTVTREYTNFKLIDEWKLVFDQGTFELYPQYKIVTTLNESGIYVFEHDNEIYLLDKAVHCTWFSMDKGKSWYFYPKELDSFLSEYGSIEIENGYLSVFNSWEMKKVFYKFVLFE